MRHDVAGGTGIRQAVTIARMETTTLAPQSRNLRRLVGLRVIEVAAQAVTIVVVVYGMDMAVPTSMLLALTVGLAFITLFTWWRTQQRWLVTDAELAAHLLIDIGVLTGLMCFTGGSANPFVTLYLLPFSIAAAMLTARYIGPSRARPWLATPC